MHIVVEGPDGAGKSTLIESARQKDFYFVRVQTSGPPPSVHEAINVGNWVDLSGRLNIVWDRIPFISDRVYGPTLRKIDLFGSYGLKFGLDDIDLIVYCRPPLESIRANVEKDKHLKGVKDHVEQLVVRYDNLMKDLGALIPIRTYDFTQDDPTKFWSSVISSFRAARV